MENFTQETLAIFCEKHELFLCVKKGDLRYVATYNIILIQQCTYSYNLYCLNYNRAKFLSVTEKAKKQTNVNVICDIHNGRAYQAVCSENCLLANDNNISLMLNTDGVQVYQSTNYSIWPVLLMINELPFTARYLKESNSSTYMYSQYVATYNSHIIAIPLFTEKIQGT